MSLTRKRIEDCMGMTYDQDGDTHMACELAMCVSDLTTGGE